jgi:hypothetical protein
VGKELFADLALAVDKAVVMNIFVSLRLLLDPSMHFGPTLQTAEMDVPVGALTVAGRQERLFIVTLETYLALGTLTLNRLLCTTLHLIECYSLLVLQMLSSLIDLGLNLHTELSLIGSN